jgi:hypothetical protein
MKLTNKEKEIVIFSLEELCKKIASEKLDVFYELKFSKKEEIDEYTQYDIVKEIIEKIKEKGI